MECINGSFLLSMFWSGVLMWGIVWLRCSVDTKPLLFDLVSPPVLLSVCFALVYSHFFYVSSAFDESIGLFSGVKSLEHFVSSLPCWFAFFMRALSKAIFVSALYTYMDCKHTDVMNEFKRSVSAFFTELFQRFKKYLPPKLL